MTNNEAKQKYLPLFLIAMGEAAIESGIEEYKYKDVEEIIHDGKIVNFSRQKEILEDEEAPFETFVFLLIVRLIIRLNGYDPEKFTKITNLKERVEDIFQRYLFRPTYKFTSKYGLPTIKEICNKNIEIKMFTV